MLEPDQIYNAPEKSRQTFLDLRLIQLLLAGLYFVFGRTLSRAEKEAYRDRAYRVRRAIAAVKLIDDTHINNMRVVRTWSGDDKPSWRETMRCLWTGFSLRINRWVRRLERPHSAPHKTWPSLFGQPAVKAPP